MKSEDNDTIYIHLESSEKKKVTKDFLEITNIHNWNKR